MIDVITQEKVNIDSSSKKSSFTEDQSDPNKLERDQSNAALNYFFGDIAHRKLSPKSLIFEEIAYNSIFQSNVSFNCNTSPTPEKSRFIPNHAYSIGKVKLDDSGQIYFEVYNPHLFRANNRNACKLDVSLQDLKDNFDGVTLFRLKESNQTKDFYSI